MLSRLTAQPFVLALPASVHSVGFAVRDHAAVIEALSMLDLEGMPVRAVHKRRAEFLAGRYAALQALQALGVPGVPGRNEDGSPRWPAGAVGSITHGAERALCAVASSRELRGIGVDTERLLAADVSDPLKLRICSAAELALGREQLALTERELVSLAFSAKESLYKCLYPLVGRFMDLHAARVLSFASIERDARGLHGELALELTVDWSQAFRTGQRFSALFHLDDSHVESAVLLRA